jgi:PTS system cellobiose-specific IIB component
MLPLPRRSLWVPAAGKGGSCEPASRGEPRVVMATAPRMPRSGDPWRADERVAMARYKVLLVCAAGMSSSLLEAAAIEAAKKRGHELDIHAISAPRVGIYDFASNPLDMVLVAPQVRYKQKSVRQLAEPLGIVVDVIDSVTYGMVDGDKLFDQIMQGVAK